MLTLLIAIIILSELFTLSIEYLNYKNWSPEIPKQLKNFIDEKKYKKSQAYNKVNQKFGFIESLFSTGIMIIALLFGFFGYIDNYINSNLTTNGTLVTLIFFGIIFIGFDLLTTPFSIYNTFVIEEKFGFNKTTVKTFILDKIKGYLLTVIIGGIVLFLFKTFYDFAGNLFWLYAWITITIISLFISVFYTNLIIPIFNKLKPLEKGELRDEIENYSKKVKFPLDKILIMDASKRSTKGNAFFNGLFGKKNIVLFDTLIEKHSKNELVAVLAHEVGHFKGKHVQKLILMGIMQTGIMLFLLGVFINNPQFSEALRSASPSFHLGLIAFGLLYTPISLITGVFSNIVSRKYEFEADAYGKKTYGGNHLAAALKKLSIDNLSNLNPHPAYVFVNYSHPPVLERIMRLED
ncbi:M48 family metallopeptidase [Candidatus Dojkabacteria bacterium]|nr:M48 family metallopeptidase [Candidatus Dojkabacteria bacterium]